MYLARVVEEVAPEFAGTVRCETVWIKTREGARRFRELSAALGRLAPIPSIFLDGELAYGTTPPVEELRRCLSERCAPTAGC